MPKKKSALVQKVSSLLEIFIFLAKLKKPITPVLLTFKKTRKLKKFMLLKHFNHYSTYVKEYEFSPSSSPLIQFHRKPRKERTCFGYSNVVLISKCLGIVREEEEEEEEEGKERCCLEPLPCRTENGVSREMMDLWEDESVDERAERFIQRFYEEMRRQKMESHLQLNSMLEM